MGKQGNLKIQHRLDYERDMLNAFRAGLLAAEMIRHEYWSEDAKKLEEEYAERRGFSPEALETRSVE